jgi:hypothetical protein
MSRLTGEIGLWYLKEGGRLAQVDRALVSGTHLRVFNNFLKIKKN